MLSTEARQAMVMVQDRLEASRNILVVSHVDPDGDALGTQLAFGEYLRSLGKTVWLLRDSEIPQKYKFLPGAAAIASAAEVPDTLELDTVLVLECPHLDRIGSGRRFIKDDVSLVNIDHHPGNNVDSGASWLDPASSSVGEMAYEYFSMVGYQITAEVATLLYAAILTDTGRFRFESTSSRTLEIAGELVASGANPRLICDKVYYEMDASVWRLAGRGLSNLEYHADGRICLMSLTKNDLVAAGADHTATDGLVDYTLYTGGVNTGALLKEIDAGRTKVSLRSRQGYDVGSVASQLNGGGHRNAASGLIPLPMAEAKIELVKMLRELNDAAN